MGEAKRKEERVEVSTIDRPSMHPPMRDEDPRASAERRAQEILGHIGSLDEGTDEFYFDPAMVPAGWCYEWKRYILLGQEDPAYQVALSRNGWQAVPVDRHPEMMPVAWKGPILRKGQMLMERPQTITDMVRKNEKKRADDQVRQKEAQVKSSAVANLPGGFDATNAGQAIRVHGVTGTKTTIEPMAIPQK